MIILFVVYFIVEQYRNMLISETQNPSLYYRKQWIFNTDRPNNCSDSFDFLACSYSKIGIVHLNPMQIENWYLCDEGMHVYMKYGFS